MLPFFTYIHVCVMCSVITYMHIYMDMPLKRFKDIHVTIFPALAFVATFLVWVSLYTECRVYPLVIPSIHGFVHGVASCQPSWLAFCFTVSVFVPRCEQVVHVICYRPFSRFTCVETPPHWHEKVKQSFLCYDPFTGKETIQQMLVYAV